jgi:hypothetical protein
VTTHLPAWTVEVDSTDGRDTSDAHLQQIADTLDTLAAASCGALTGPVVGARVPTGIIWLVLTVEAETPEDAARLAATTFRQAIVTAGIGALRVAVTEALDPLPVGT